MVKVRQILRNLINWEFRKTKSSFQVLPFQTISPEGWELSFDFKFPTCLEYKLSTKTLSNANTLINGTLEAYMRRVAQNEHLSLTGAFLPLEQL